MDDLFMVLMLISIVAVPIFVIMTIVALIKKDYAKGKKWIVFSSVSLVMIIVSSIGVAVTYNDPEDTTIEDDKEIKQPKPSENVETFAENTVENVEPKATINTSVFQYAKFVDVTDARDTNKHITLQIDLADDAQPGMGTKNVLTQMYDFLQQEDIAGAEAVTFYVRVKEQKVAQFKTTVANFTADPNTPMISTVLAASEIEMLSPEVKSFGETTGLW